MRRCHYEEDYGSLYIYKGSAQTSPCHGERGCPDCPNKSTSRYYSSPTTFDNNSAQENLIPEGHIVVFGDDSRLLATMPFKVFLNFSWTIKVIKRNNFVFVLVKIEKNQIDKLISFMHMHLGRSQDSTLSYIVKENP